VKDIEIMDDMFGRIKVLLNVVEDLAKSFSKA